MGDEALFDRIAFVLKGVGISTMLHTFEHCVLHIAIDGFEFVKGFLCECCADSRVSITVKGPNRNVSEFLSIKRRKESAGTGDGGGEAIWSPAERRPCAKASQRMSENINSVSIDLATCNHLINELEDLVKVALCR